MRTRRKTHWLAAAVLGVACTCSAPATAMRVRTLPDELLVRPHAALKVLARAQLSAEGTVTEKEIPTLGVQLVRAAPGSGAAIQRRLRASRLFRFVESNAQVAVDALPDDPLFPQQWGLTTTSVPQVWDSTRGTGVVIAVVDTGIDASHPDLVAQVLPGFNTISESSDTDDDNGHGTHMAGIAAAAGFNGVGVIGVAPDAALLPVKVLDSSGSGTYADLAEGIVYAADHGARVINLSLGGDIDSATLSDAIAYAESTGAVVAAAAGNDATSAPTYPAAYPGVIAVGATDAQDALAPFSNFGNWITLVAPGVNILTTDWGGGYATSSGTSPATPFVSGAAALLLAANPQLDPHLVGPILAMSSDDLGAPGFDTTFGWGRLDVASALNEATALGSAGSALPPAISVSAPPDAAEVQGLVSLGVTSSNAAPIARVEYSIDGTVVAAAADQPFLATWNANVASPGPHVLSATAYDAFGNRGSAAPVSVLIAGTQPGCSTPGAACLRGGAARANCFAQWLVTAVEQSTSPGRSHVITCTDGSACDADGKADGACTFSIGVCFSVTDGGGRQTCQPRALDRFTLLTPQPSAGQDPLDTANATALVDAVAALSDAQGTGTCVAGLVGAACAQDADCDSTALRNDGSCALQSASLANVVGEQCTALQAVRVPLRQGRSGMRAGSRRLKAAAVSAATATQRALTGRDALRLVCLPPA